MKREELNTSLTSCEIYDRDTKKFDSGDVYLKEEADSVLNAMEARIKELEDDKLRQENYCESLVNENKRLNEIIISKDMVGAELVNENKALRHNIEDYKCDNEALKARIKELEEVVSKMENAQKWISVDDCTPYANERVLVITNRRTFAPATFSPLTNSWIEHGQLLGTITHWMPLLPPPTDDLPTS